MRADSLTCRRAPQAPPLQSRTSMQTAMLKRAHRMALLVTAATVAPAAAARAQVPPGGEVPSGAPEAAPPPAPPPMTDPDPQPLAPIPRSRYGQAGSFEAGASLGFTSAEEAAGGNLTPHIGWFVGQNLELSALLGLHYVRASGQDATLVSALVEPSYHLPFGRTTFGFLGLGLGGSYVEEAGLGFALAPRVGANILLGRSAGLLTPSLAYQYSTSDTRATDDGMLVVTSALSANLGYSLVW